MLRRISLLSIFAPALLIAAAGCHSVNEVERQTPVAKADVIQDRRVLYDEGFNGLERVAGVTQIRQATVSGDILRIDIDVHNARRTQERFNWLIEWYDDHAMLVTSTAAKWQSEIIEGKQTKTLVAVAPTPAAKDFKIHFEKSRLD